MKKIILLFCAIWFFAEKSIAQSKINYSLFTYTEPKDWGVDESDPLQNVYFLEVTKSDYLVITIWQKKKANASAAQDYLQFIKLVKEQYDKITDYTREPTIVSDAKTKSKTQSATLKGLHQNILTGKTEPLSIILKVFTKNNQTAALHFASNNMDKCKTLIDTFLRSFKLK